MKKWLRITLIIISMIVPLITWAVGMVMLEDMLVEEIRKKEK